MAYKNYINRLNNEEKIIKEKVYELVKEQAEKMNCDNHINRLDVERTSKMVASSRYRHWGLNMFYIWDLIEKYAKEIFPPEMDF